MMKFAIKVVKYTALRKNVLDSKGRCDLSSQTIPLLGLLNAVWKQPLRATARTPRHRASRVGLLAGILAIVRLGLRGVQYKRAPRYADQKPESQPW